MPIFKLAMAVLVSLIPLNGLRVLSYSILFGCRISESRIGFGTVIIVDNFAVERARLGWKSNNE